MQVCPYCDGYIENDSDEPANERGEMCHRECLERDRENGPSDRQLDVGPTYPGIDGCPHRHYFPNTQPSNCGWCSGTE